MNYRKSWNKIYRPIITVLFFMAQCIFRPIMVVQKLTRICQLSLLQVAKIENRLKTKKIENNNTEYRKKYNS